MGIACGPAAVPPAAWPVVNLAASFTLSQFTMVFGGIDNLLNEQYQDLTGFGRPGFGPANCWWYIRT